MGKYHKGIRIEGADEFLLAVNITGHGAPTEDTEAEPGMCYLDEDSEHGDLYKCIGMLVTETGTVYRWKKLAGQEEVDQLSKAIADLEGKIPTEVGGMTKAQISALDGMFKIASFMKDPTAEYTAFKAAFGIEDSGEEEPDEPETPTKTLTSISAVYSGGDVAVGTDLNDLTGIVVTATYSDGSTENVTGYTLSGEIAEGENTITVSYSGKTTTFTVTGVAESVSAELPTDSLLGYWDLRNATSTTDWEPTVGDASAYQLRSVNTWDAQTVNGYGALLNNGTYGGAKVQKLGDDGAWADINYGTEFTIVTLCYDNFVAPVDYYGFDGFLNFYPTPAYVNSAGENSSGTRQMTNIKIPEGKYATIIIRVNNNILDIYCNGEVAQSADGSLYSDFDYWRNSGLNIRSMKNQTSGHLTAIAVYNKALTDVEVVEICEYLKTMEVTA